MAAADEAKWNERYSGRGVDVLAAAPDALAEAGLVDRVPTSGAALDVACGLGAQTIWMADRGLDVTAIDVSGEAVARVVDAARRHGVHDRVNALTLDLGRGRGLPVALTDFDVIVCQRFRDPSLFSEFVTRLRPGGLLVVTVLSRTGTSRPGPFHAPAGELLAAFDRDDCTVLHHAEHDGQESIVIETSDV